MAKRANSGGARRRTEWLVSLPSLAWLALFFVIPTLIVFAISLKPSDPLGGVGTGWTLQTLRSLGNPNYPAIVWRTVWLSVITTAACLVLGLPAGYHIARAAPRHCCNFSRNAGHSAGSLGAGIRRCSGSNLNASSAITICCWPRPSSIT